MQDKIEAIHRLRSAIKRYSTIDTEKRYDVEPEILTWMASGCDLNEVAASYEEKRMKKLQELVERHNRMAEAMASLPLSADLNAYASSKWTGRQ